MKYKEIKYVNKKVSQIFYGTASAPFLAGENCNELLDSIYALGINTFDTARNYGMSEKAIGMWLRSGVDRDAVVILSKCGHHDVDTLRKRVNEKEIREDFAVSSDLLGTDYIDIYILHRDDPGVPAGEICEIFNALHAEGKIGAFGGSNWTHQRIEAVNEYAYSHNLIPFTVSSPNFGLADQVADPWGGGCVTISGPGGADARAWYEKEGMPVVAYSSLGRGLFSGKLKSADAAQADRVLDEFAMKGYGCPENFERLRRCEELAAKKGVSVAQIAMAFIYAQPLNTFAVVSTQSAKRMKQNIAALDIELDKDEADWLDLR